MTQQWIECGKTWEEFCDLVPKEDRVGLFLEILDEGRPLKQFLVGHVNAVGGECDCCRWFNFQAIVVRYQRVFNARPPQDH